MYKDKKVYKNMLQEYLENFFEKLNDRKIIILGCRGVSAIVFCAIKYLGYDILYFLDPGVKYDKEHAGKKEFFGKEVLPCNQLLYENPEEIAVLNTYHYIGRIDPLLSAYGFEENINYYNIESCLKSKYCDIFDPILGYSRMDDLQGIKIFGKEAENVKRIVTLGGSTTDFSFSGIKSWPEILQELLNEQDIPNVIYNGGICGYSSCQERDKFIRDIVGLKPDIVISLSGINDINWTLVCKHAPYYSDYFVNKMVQSICENGIDDNKTREDKLSLGLVKEFVDYENWFNNERIMHGVAKEFGIGFYVFLQPFIFEGSYEMSNFERGWMELFLKIGLSEHPAIKMIYEGSSSFYKGAKELISKVDYMFDITDMFDDVVGVYTDSVHYDQIGNELLSRVIFSKLNKVGVIK